MVTTFTKQGLSAILSLVLVVSTTPFETGCSKSRTASTTAADALGAPAGPTGPNEYSGVPLSAEELQQLVAPIALHPDALLAQILAAATFPDQVADAANWLHQNNVSANAMMQAVDAQPWDPSVKGLTQFPPVLGDLATNLSWTSALGEAYYNQPADVMFAIQVLRTKAQAAGNLKSGPQIIVKQTVVKHTVGAQQPPQVIVIQAANPQVVYVPTYSPAVVYGTPYVTPGYSSADVAATAVIAFGVGIAVGAMMKGSPWGYNNWNCGWHGKTTVVYRGGPYYGNPAWSGGPPRPTPYGAPPATVRYGAGYNPSSGNYGRGVTVSNGYGTASAGKAYNPNTGAYARGGTVSNGYGTANGGQAYNPKTGASARGGTVSNGYGTTSAGQAYNPNTGASAATRQNSNAYGSSGSSTATRNGNTAYTQHQSGAYGSTGSVQTSAGGKGAGATTANGNSAAMGKTANGDKYATANGNVYSNTGSGWSGNSNNAPKNNASTYAAPSNNAQRNTGATASPSAAKGWGGQEKTGGSSAFSGGSGGGWGAQSASARGSASMNSGGGRSGGGRR